MSGRIATLGPWRYPGIAATILPAIVIMASATEVAEGAGKTYFVAPDGNGISVERTRPGNVNDTIRAICDGTPAQIAGGDAITFLDGTYLTSSFDLPLAPDDIQSGRHGNSIAMVSRHCGAGKYIRLVADHRLGAVIRNDVSANETSGGFDIRHSSYIWIEGFHIVGVDDPAVAWEGGIKFSHGSHHVVARHNLIERVGGGGIAVMNATHVILVGNEVSKSSGSHPYCASGISLYRLDNPEGFPDGPGQYSNYVVGNRVSGVRSKADCDSDADISNGVHPSDGNCIIVDLLEEQQYQNRTLIANNLCTDNGAAGAHIYNSSNVDVYNNTMFMNGAVHDFAELSVTCTSVPEVRNVRFYNNLVIAGRRSARATNWGGDCVMTGIVFSHNLFADRPPLEEDFEGVPFLGLTVEPSRLKQCEPLNLLVTGVSAAGLVQPVPDPVTSDFAIAEAGSPAVDGGSPSACPGDDVYHAINRADTGIDVIDNDIGRDLGGGSRLVGGAVDIGAYEYGNPTAPPAP